MFIKLLYLFISIILVFTFVNSGPITQEDNDIDVYTQLDDMQKSMKNLKFRLDVSDKTSALTEKYMDTAVLNSQLENMQKSMENLKLRLDVSDKTSALIEKYMDTAELNSQLENMQKSMEKLKFRLDVSDKISALNEKYINTEELMEKSRKIIKPVFDIRIDSLPEHCRTNTTPSNCAEVTECTQRSGYYNISLIKDKSFFAFCDYNFEQGDWLYILRRIDGSENFQRSWDDYVKGFGNVDSEYWIGLDNLYALTNLNGPQELYVYLEDLQGNTRHAKYDHFVIGNAAEKYQLKSLGSYTGDAGDNLRNYTSAKFSTPDNVDNDIELKKCVVGRKCGWWFKNPGCSDSALTGFYHNGPYSGVGGFFDGAFWTGFNGKGYSHKQINLMIRRQRITLN